MAPSAQLRTIVFTLFDLVLWETSIAEHEDWGYICGGLETCPTTGREHWQCYGEFKKKKRWGAIKTLLGGAHFEPRKGSQREAIVYCQKEGRFWERGEPLRQGERNDLSGAAQLALNEGLRVASGVLSGQQFSVARNFLTYNEEGRHRKPRVTWIKGASGTGKSRRAREMAGESDTYTKNDGTKWWDGYDGHTCVVIDDFRGSWWPLTYMLALLDRYEFRIEYKGGMRQFLAEEIIITSIKGPTEAYGDCAYEPVQQLLRRIDEVIDMGESKEQEVGVILAPSPQQLL